MIPRCRQIDKTKFGGLQKLHAGYLNGWLDIEGEVIKRYLGDFDFDDKDYAD